MLKAASYTHAGVFPEARLAAYQERAVGDTERRGLEEVANNVEFSVFVAPMTLPKQTLALVKGVMPEINFLNVGTTQAAVLIPNNDANTRLSRQIGAMIHGAEIVNVTFLGPAYRSLPKD